MATTADVIASVRNKLRDRPKLFQTDIDGDGQDQIYELPVVIVDPASLVVSISTDNAPSVPTTDYTLDPYNGTLRLNNNTILGTNQTLTTVGTHYTWFLDADIATEAAWFTNTIDLSAVASTFEDVTTSDPRFELIVRGVLLNCLWSLLIETSLDIDVRNPEGVDIPTSQRFHQLEQLVELWTQRYETLAGQLNLGLDRIQMMTLRRTSLSTGRLVPVYTAQEFDDQATPQRRFPLIDNDQLMSDPPRPASIPPNNGAGFYGW